MYHLEFIFDESFLGVSTYNAGQHHCGKTIAVTIENQQANVITLNFGYRTQCIIYECCTLDCITTQRLHSLFNCL